MSVARYVAPDTLEGIVAEMQEQEGSYAFMAGGTIVQPLLASGSWLPRTVIGLWRAPLGAIERVNGDVALGANARLRDVALEGLPGGLSDAARQVGGPAVRNRATLGGNIATGRGDLIVPLLALGARVTLASTKGTTDLSIDDVVDGATGEVSALAQGELLTRVMVPAKAERGVFMAVGRKAYNTPCVATVGVVANFEPDNRNVVKDVRVAVHGPQPWPQRAGPVERALAGRELNAAAITDAVAALESVGDGFSDSVASADYRLKISGVVLRQALEKIAGSSRQ